MEEKGLLSLKRAIIFLLVEKSRACNSSNGSRMFIFIPIPFAQDEILQVFPLKNIDTAPYIKDFIIIIHKDIEQFRIEMGATLFF